MPLQETATYLVEVTLSTEVGELPSNKEAEQLIFEQMEGELDDSGLKCLAVVFVKNLMTDTSREKSQRRCKNCREPVEEFMQWCSQACFKADQGSDFDREEG